MEETVTVSLKRFKELETYERAVEEKWDVIKTYSYGSWNAYLSKRDETIETLKQIIKNRDSEVERLHNENSKHIQEIYTLKNTEPKKWWKF